MRGVVELYSLVLKLPMDQKQQNFGSALRCGGLDLRLAAIRRLVDRVVGQDITEPVCPSKKVSSRSVRQREV